MKENESTKIPNTIYPAQITSTACPCPTFSLYGMPWHYTLLPSTIKDPITPVVLKYIHDDYLLKYMNNGYLITTGTIISK